MKLLQSMTSQLELPIEDAASGFQERLLNKDMDISRTEGHPATVTHIVSQGL